MNKITYWEFSQDNIRESAIEMRALSAINYHKEILALDKGFNDNAYDFRYDCLKIIKKIIGYDISGIVLEIGAGTGIYSCHIAKLRDVEKVYILDYSKICVEELIPFVIKRFRLNESEEKKLYPVVGSFNDIKLPDNSVDFVIAMEALHHSEDREITFREVYKVLKVGGYLIAMDRANFNYLTNRELNEQLDVEYDDKRKKRNCFEKNYTRRMNSEHKPLLAEYEYLTTKCGFYSRIFWFGNFLGKKGWLWRTFGKLFFKIYGEKMFKKHITDFYFLKIPYYPWFSKHLPRRRILIVARKEPYIEMP